ncbi:ATP-binding cassette domain-containing protein [Actinopolymorpha pittospori]|uniref:Alpha-D-ribose 1-methylphosphonate 5-triphosphate synthase subunit PhnL n=1 Tax=Actinopolymorpha pittospori TaxID=648752 RepID=A0A927N2H3_9ACTN|nr:ATP-binding cassette domain-containing protein [Actinopolymorpha pittospori]MBE1609088.1 alpha-D-ribose 1-methylphosphonate 5-triphosphate synthase subunit PhnL [Actinopolymorpha pittospori]
MTHPEATGQDLTHPAPVLSVRDLTKTFTLHAIGREVVSLRSVSFTLYAGEHLAVIGASGAGKSSLLRCIYRNYLPDTGTVQVHDGGRTTDLTALDDRTMVRLRGRDFGYVSQFLDAPPRQGPLRLVTNAARRRGLSPAAGEEAAAASLAKLGVEERLWDVDCSVLSGGERQRVNLAAGTVSPPRLLLLDEPVSALDPANRARALTVIEDLRHQDVSVLAIYHDMTIIRRVASRVLLMENGVITADGTPDEVLGSGVRGLEEVYA